MNIFKTLELGTLTKSAKQTQLIAAQVALNLPVNQVLKLSGSLGTGKTTFVQGLAKAWAVEETVKSPTFNLYSIYQGERQLVHLDAFRLNDPSQAEYLLIEEFLNPPFCLAIEWPERVEGWMEEDVWYLQFSIVENFCHRIQLISRPA